MNDQAQIRVFSVNDHPLLNEGTAGIINNQPAMLQHRLLTRAGALKHREVVADAVGVAAAQEPHQAFEKAYAEIERLKDQLQY